MGLKEQRVWHDSFLPPSGLPERFADAEIGGIRNAVVRDTVERYLGNFWEAAEQGLAPAFFGRLAEWKTYGAAVVLRHVQAERLPARFVECGAWFLEADALFYRPEGPRRLAQLAAVPFLVLDDVTQVLHNTRAAELMANVVAQRFSAKLPTLVTGNAIIVDEPSLDAFGKLYRADFARRIRHGSTGYWGSV